MESNKPDVVEEAKHKDDVALPNEGEPATGDAEIIQKETPVPITKQKAKRSKARKHKQKKVKKGSKKDSPVDSASESSSEDSSSSSSESSDSESDEGDKMSKRQKSKWKQAAKKLMAKKKAKKFKNPVSDTSSSGSDSSSVSSGSDSSSEEESKSKRRKKKSKKATEASDESEGETEAAEAELPVEEAAAPGLDTDIKLKAITTFLQLLTQQSATATPPAPPAVPVGTPAIPPPARPRTRRELQALKLAKQKEVAEANKVRKFCFSKAILKALDSGISLSRLNRIPFRIPHAYVQGKKVKKGSTSQFKRVNHLWDTILHQWVTKEEIDEVTDEFDNYGFVVQRNFDYDNHYTSTIVKIKSKALKEALEEIMKDVQGQTLEAEAPSVDPNMLFLFLEELRTHYKKTLKARLKKAKKTKKAKKIKNMIAHCKCLVRYLDEDYADTKKTLYPLLDAGNITFELLWALFKPNSIAYTSTYGDHDNPRCFKVDRATKETSFIKGEWYAIEGRYLEYDGKNFGLGEFEVSIENFKGSRKITSLTAYPLKYHMDEEGITKQLVERGKHFIQLTGQNFRCHKGLAFQKKRKGIQKFNINGRVMVDPATFRRINPNYQISVLKPKDDGEESDSDSEGEGCGCGDGHEEDEDGEGRMLRQGEEEKESIQRMAYRVVQVSKKRWRVVQVLVDENGRILIPEKLDTVVTGDDSKTRAFTEEELLIASPVVLGFALNDKGWLEFSLNGISDIEWNDQAFASLVIPENQKHVVKALVSSHKFHSRDAIDDVVQGKGRGKVFVLHGPPGVGKTLTAEGIAEDLRVPLYAVSMGELGTETNRLEAMLQQVMDIAHSWGAVLLLDEADVFLERRQHQDVHRNALVSIFLRQLEYFQGVLFLTTNRVETFDEAFQSRIHAALRYGELSQTARKAVWKQYIEKVRVKEGIEVMPFKETDLEDLARKPLNGRQIKNTVGTAQALALFEEKGMGMDHIKRVLEVAESFDRDLRGQNYVGAQNLYN
ncbi:hypothetical protein E6O75_ATG00843 [Venturia nashicola]|uniref:AAA+ ATPase domain-containing protein n=1 Tax=Venturia nashicola TaxID=86259 RepID=A0A4Z1PC42_9PEZI|nr:hypothetical protein E6O75_ATG00843 [Venturia nashicola]